MDQTQFNAERFNADEQIANLERQLRGDVEALFSTDTMRTILLNKRINELETKLKEVNNEVNDRLNDIAQFKNAIKEAQKTFEEQKKLLNEQLSELEGKNAILTMALSNATQELENIRISTYTSNTTGPVNKSYNE